MKKLMLTMLSVVGMMLFVALPAKACTSYYVGKDCTKDGTTMYGRTEDYSPKKDKVYKVIQPKKVGKNATFKDETGATTFQAPIKVETTYRYTICRDSEGAEDGYFGEFGTNTKGVSMSATTSSSVAKTVGKFDPYIDAYESKVGGITEENLADYVLCQASSAREGVELLEMLLIQLVLVKVMAFSSQTRTKYGILKSLLVITTVPLRCLLTKQQSFQTVL